MIAAGHRGRAADERAVGEDLDRPDPQPFVAHPAAEPEVEPGALRAGGADDPVERREIGHDGGAHAERTGLPRGEVGVEVERGVAQAGDRADARLGDRSDALAQRLLGRGADVVDDGVDGERLVHPGDEVHRTLLDEACGGAAVRGPCDVAAVDVGDVREVGEPGDLEGPRVGDSHVGGHVLEPYRVVGGPPVELCGERVRIAELVLVVAGAVHPLPRLRGGRGLLDGGVERVHRADRRRPEVNAVEPLAAQREVMVDVVEGRYGRRPAEIEGLRRREPRDVVVERADPAADDADRVHLGALGIHRAESSVGEDRVEVHGSELRSLVRRVPRASAPRGPPLTVAKRRIWRSRIGAEDWAA